MPVSAKERAQADLVLTRLPGAAAYPEPGKWDDDDVDGVDYLYRKDTILTREPDADRVVDAIIRILREAEPPPVYDDAAGPPPTSGQADREPRIPRELVPGTRSVISLTVESARISLLDILDRLDRDVGDGVARLDHVVYVCPNICAATEPIVVPPGTDPVPPPGLNACGCRPCHGLPRPECDGDGVFISFVDTGLIDDAAVGHPWLAGVGGTTDPVPGAGTTSTIGYDTGHGTFVAGVARCMAPKVSAYVERAFDYVGANFETKLPPALNDALSHNPDILEFTFCATTRADVSCRLPRGDLGRCPVRELAGSGVVQQLRQVGRCLRARRGPYQCLSRGNLRVHGASRLRGGSAGIRGNGQVERDVVLHAGRSRADRGPDVLDRGERAAGGGCVAATCLEPGGPRARRCALSGPGLL